VAVITAAAPLTPLQEERLVRTLEAAYGRAIQLNITYDNTVLGGLKCRVGDELVDGSVFTRFADVRRELAA
jgi:F-type H+-transporting ATPase subunit delta